MRDFIRWYNHEHRRIRFVTPEQRHRGEDHEVPAKRHALYQQARNQHPHRWSGATRNWQPIGAVTLNPERDSVILEHATENNIQQLAA